MSMALIRSDHTSSHADMGGKRKSKEEEEESCNLTRWERGSGTFQDERTDTAM